MISISPVDRAFVLTGAGVSAESGTHQPRSVFFHSMQPRNEAIAWKLNGINAGQKG
jgi:NAD-dependent SIR2 family protein deacetylase